MAFKRVPIGSLPRGLKGEPGDRGLPGVNAVANDTATAAQIAAKESATRAALRRTVTMNGGLYAPTQYAGLRWRTALTQIRSGFRQGHVAILGDSIPGTGAPLSSPKYKFNWPGRLRQMLDHEFGPGGTGVVICDWDIKATPAYDDRFAYGATVNAGYGFFRHGALQVSAGSYIDFTATTNEFLVYNIGSSGGLVTASVDGTVKGTINNTGLGGVLPSLTREAGTHANQVVTKVPSGALGAHTLRVVPPAGGFATFFGFEGRITTPGTIRVSNPSISGESLASLFSWAGNNDETNGMFGLPMIDVLKADLLIIALGINDWNIRRPIAELKADLGTLISRQMASGATKAGGDVLLVWNPQPDLINLPAGTSAGPTWQQYRDAYYEIADTYNVPLLDMGDRWKDYTTGNAIGMFGDGIHPSDAGSYDIAPAVRRAILNP